MNSHEFAAKVAEDRAASFTLQRMIATAAERDVLDALIDAEALAAFCKLRAKEAGIPMNTPMAETAGRECVRLSQRIADLEAALDAMLRATESGMASTKAPAWATASHAQAVLAGDCAADFANVQP